MDVKLVMFRRNGQRKDFDITEKLTTIGRGEDCTLRIPLSIVSRRHCELIKGDDELRIRDLASSNGTYVNNRRVNEAVLEAGDRLALGSAVFTVQIDGHPEDIAPAVVKAGASDETDIEPAEPFDPLSALESFDDEEDEDEDEDDDGTVDLEGDDEDEDDLP